MLLKLLYSAFLITCFPLAHAQSNHSESPLNQARAEGKRINGYKVLCFHESPLNYKQINTTHCTHLVSAYATLDPDEYVIRNSSAPVLTSSLKETDPGLKTIIAIGGSSDSWGEDDKYTKMARNGTLRKNFIDSVIEFMEYYDFDGFDFVWFENHQNRTNYILLLHELKERFGARYELFIELKCTSGAHIASDLMVIYDIVDMINVWTTNFVGNWVIPKQVGHHAALKQRPEAASGAPMQSEWGIGDDLRKPSDPRLVSIDSCIAYFFDKLKPRIGKLSLGIAFYGLGFTLTDGARGDPFDSFEKGVDEWYDYATICSSLTDTKSSDVPIVTYDHNYWIAPYFKRGRLWIGYDDERSVRIKVDWMKDNRLGGVTVYNFEQDDVNGVCYNMRKYPLLSAIHEQVLAD